MKTKFSAQEPNAGGKTLAKNCTESWCNACDIVTVGLALGLDIQDFLKHDSANVEVKTEKKSVFRSWKFSSVVTTSLIGQKHQSEKKQDSIFKFRTKRCDWKSTGST